MTTLDLEAVNHLLVGLAIKSHQLQIHSQQAGFKDTSLPK